MSGSSVYHQYVLSMYFINTVGLPADSLAPHTRPFWHAQAFAILLSDSMFHVARSFLQSDLVIFRPKIRPREFSA